MPVGEWAWRGVTLGLALGLCVVRWRWGRITAWAWLVAFSVVLLVLAARFISGGLSQAEAQMILVAWAVGLGGWAVGRLPGAPVKLTLVFTTLLPDVRFIILVVGLPAVGSLGYLLLTSRSAAWRWLAAWAGALPATLRVPRFNEVVATRSAQPAGRGLPVYLACAAAVLYSLWWTH